jgi:hypothetical protein
MRRAAAVVVLVAGVLAGAPATAQAGAATPLPVVVEDTSVTRIGSFRPSRNAKLSAAIRAFGRPTSRRGRSGACTVRWRSLGLKIVFANFGSPGRSTCSPSVGLAQSFVASGPRFATESGLRPGQPSSQIRVLYPDTEFERGAWTLVSAVLPYGDGSESPILRAFARRGAVASLAGWIGGAGD